MRKIFLFMMVSLDGFFEGPKHDLSWHNVDKEFSDFAARQLNTVDTILFGSRTYEMMSSFWPTTPAKKADPETAKLMNNINKIVFSKTLQKADWQNTTLENNPVEIIKKLKNEPGKDIAVIGSNNLCVNLIENGLLDEFRIMINPAIIGSGNELFKGIKNKLNLNLIKTKTFHNGNVLLYYQTTKLT